MNISFFDDKPSIDELDFKLEILNRFKNITIDELPNLIFYGLPTSGKTTKIYALLSTIFDKKVYDLKNITFEEDRKTIIYRTSIYHIEINPITLGSNEKIFISSFLKQYVETRNIGLDIPKVILIKNANLLSKISKLALRKIIEKNLKTARFIFEVNNLSNLTEPLISRCLLIRVRLPKIDEIRLCLKNFSLRKGYKISNEKIDQIINESNKISMNIDLKKIFGYYFYYLHTSKDFKFLYHDKFDEIINYITHKKISFVNLLKIREIINEIYINLVSMEDFLFSIHNKLCILYSKNNDLMYKLLDLTVKCDNNMKKGNKECLHLEYYIIAIIDILNTKK